MTVYTEPSIIAALAAPDADEHLNRLRRLGILDEVAIPLLGYLHELNQCDIRGAGSGILGRDTGGRYRLFDVDPRQTSAGKYVQVVSIEAATERVDSVHSVVIKETGAVCKAAGWKGGPVKSTSKDPAKKGKPIVRFDLTDFDSLARLYETLRTNDNAVHGGYLYV